MAETSRWFGPHHDAKLEDGYLSLFDNGLGMTSVIPDLDPQSPVPLYLQIVEQVRRLLAIGALRPGDRFLTVRELGAKVRVTDPAAMVNAARDLGISLPVVIRMEGTNVEEGKKIIAESGFNFQVADGMKDAAEKVVKAAQ